METQTTAAVEAPRKDSFDFPARLLRGAGQVMFQNNAWTGFFFLIGIFWGRLSGRVRPRRMGRPAGVGRLDRHGLPARTALRRRGPRTMGIQRRTGRLRIPDIPRQHGLDVARIGTLRRPHDMGTHGIQPHHGTVESQFVHFPVRILHVDFPARGPRHARTAARPHVRPDAPCCIHRRGPFRIRRLVGLVA